MRTGRIYRKVSYGPSLDMFFLDMRTYRNANGKDDETDAFASSAPSRLPG
ncbi:MAG: alkaline phosphatase D family protein [Hyphomicrobiales bacterium]